MNFSAVLRSQLIKQFLLLIISVHWNVKVVWVVKICSDLFTESRANVNYYKV